MARFSCSPATSVTSGKVGSEGWAFGSGVTLAGLAAFFVAIVNGPLVYLGVAGWGLFMIGLVLLVSVNALINDRSDRTDRKVRRARDDRFRAVGRMLAVVGVIGFLVSSLTGLSTVISLGLWMVMAAGGVIPMVPNWRRLSGY